MYGVYWVHTLYMLQDTTNITNIDGIMPVKNISDRVQLILGEPLHNKLKKAAKKEDLNVSQLVRRILNDYFKK